MTENGGRIWAHDLGELCGGPAGRKVLADRCFLTVVERSQCERGGQAAAGHQEQRRADTSALADAASTWKPPGVSWKIPRYFAGFIGFASDFAPDQLSDSGETRELPEC